MNAENELSIIGPDDERYRSDPDKPTGPVGVRSLQELIERATHFAVSTPTTADDSGVAEIYAFPFLGIVSQDDMKLALLLNLINPIIGGVLLIGPRGTAKTTAARSLLDLLPDTERSLCQYGCLPHDIETGGMDAVCPECARKYGEGEPISQTEHAHLVELPLNARLEDVVGGIDDRASIHHRLRLKRGILAQADQNILYVDEVNLLPDEIVDAILDAAAMGRYTVRRGPMAATYRANFTLVGSMNPEEGNLRPQILDRFGLRVIVRGLDTPQDRQNAYLRAVSFRNNPLSLINQYRDATEQLRDEIIFARKRLSKVSVPEKIFNVGLSLIHDLKIDSLRAEITLFEAARAHAAADDRDEVTLEDLQRVAPLALRLRKSPYIESYLRERITEDQTVTEAMQAVLANLGKETR
ncbi:MAG: ATP-binding protein [Anaerolineaceae bacterium]|jgi:magnesium chelatase subunit I|nr:ATP-binding protein [Anaerolineaceae bacterium]